MGRKIYIRFDGQLFDPTSSSYKREVLGAMLAWGARLYYADRTVGQLVTATIEQHFGTGANVSGDIEDALFFGFWDALLSVAGSPLTIEQAIANRRAEFATFHVWLNHPTYSKPLRSAFNQMWQHGLDLGGKFCANYRRYFEKSFNESPFGPEYAFLMALQMSGFDLEDWSANREIRLREIGYCEKDEEGLFEN